MVGRHVVMWERLARLRPRGRGGGAGAGSRTPAARMWGGVLLEGVSVAKNESGQRLLPPYANMVEELSVVFLTCRFAPPARTACASWSRSAVQPMGS